MSLFAEIKAEDIMPKSLLQPRQLTVDLDTSNQNADLQFSEASQFGKNPIAVLVKSDVPPTSKPQGKDIIVLESEESEEEEDGEEQSGKAEDKEEGKVKYFLHVNFGNEEVESWVRIQLLASKELEPVVDWIILHAKSDFSLDQFLTVASDHNVQKSLAQNALRVLSFNGFLSHYEF